MTLLAAPLLETLGVQNRVRYSNVGPLCLLLLNLLGLRLRLERLCFCFDVVLLLDLIKTLRCFGLCLLRSSSLRRLAL